MSTLLVRDVRTADAEAISELYAVHVRTSIATFEFDPPTPQQWTAKIEAAANAGRPFLVGTLADEVIGYAYVSPWTPRPGYRHTVEDFIYLAAQHTGRGFGRLRRVGFKHGRWIDTILLQRGLDPAP